MTQKTKTSDVRSKIEYALLTMTGIIAVFISVADFAGLLDANSSIARRIPTLTLLSVGIIASYLVLERRGELESISTTLNAKSEQILEAISQASTRTIVSLDGVELREFASSAEIVTYARKRFANAQRIDDVTMGGRAVQARSGRDNVAYDEYQNALSAIIQNPNLIWREVVTFSSRQHFLRERARMVDPKADGYSIAYYRSPDQEEPPVRGFAVIDKEEVLIATSTHSIWFSIKHPLVAKYFSAYFDELWANARKLKHGHRIDYDELSRLDAMFQSDSVIDPKG